MKGQTKASERQVFDKNQLDGGALPMSPPCDIKIERMDAMDESAINLASSCEITIIKEENLDDQLSVVSELEIESTTDSDLNTNLKDRLYRANINQDSNTDSDVENSLARFICFRCRHMFGTESDREKHSQISSTCERCHLCAGRFETRCDLNKHSMTLGVKAQLRCSICRQAFKSMCESAVHLWNFHTKKTSLRRNARSRKPKEAESEKNKVKKRSEITDEIGKTTEQLASDIKFEETQCSDPKIKFEETSLEICDDDLKTEKVVECERNDSPTTHVTQGEIVSESYRIRFKVGSADQTELGVHYPLVRSAIDKEIQKLSANTSSGIHMNMILCLRCQYLFQSQLECDRHLRTLQPRGCFQCKCHFNNTCALNEHSRILNGANQLACFECDSVSASKCEFLQHHQNSHAGKTLVKTSSKPRVSTSNVKCPTDEIIEAPPPARNEINSSEINIEPEEPVEIVDRDVAESRSAESSCLTPKRKRPTPNSSKKRSKTNSILEENAERIEDCANSSRLFEKSIVRRVCLQCRRKFKLGVKCEDYSKVMLVQEQCVVCKRLLESIGDPNGHRMIASRPGLFKCVICNLIVNKNGD